VYCPTTLGSGGSARQYFVTYDTVNSCIYGDGNLNGKGNDAFLNTDDVSEAGTDTYGDNGWQLIDTTGTGAGGGLQGEINFGGSTSGGTFTFTDLAGLLANYSMLAIGLKDGGTPQWAIFFITPDSLSETSGLWGLSSPGGALSHGTLYGVPGVGCVDCEPFTPVPEPATLAMLGLGLLGAATARRRLARPAKKRA
jgi:hypothetical protein